MDRAGALLGGGLVHPDEFPDVAIGVGDAAAVHYAIILLWARVRGTARRDPGIRKAYQLVEEMMLLANETVAGRAASGAGRLRDSPAPAISLYSTS